MVDWWNCVPDMLVATQNYQSADDQWNGILNLPAHFETIIDSSTGTSTAKRNGEQ
jgi:hypothetical protein